MSLVGIIYKVTNLVNNKVYIGQTTQNLHTRIYHHFYDSKNANCYFHHAINKYGKENFAAEEICSATSLENLNYLEEHFICYYTSLSPNGYNIVLGGNNFKRVRGSMEGKTHSEETKKKMSKTSLGKPKSLEHARKVSLAKKGKSPAWNKGKTMPEGSGACKGHLPNHGQRVVCNETGEEFRSMTEAAHKTGILRTKIWRQLNGRVKNTKCPLTFNYINKVVSH